MHFQRSQLLREVGGMTTMNSQPCAAWGCGKNGSYEKPLCYEHWQQWDQWSLEECQVCHWLYGPEDIIANEWSDINETAGVLVGKPDAFICIRCSFATLARYGKIRPWLRLQPKDLQAIFETQIQHGLAEPRPQVPARKELVRKTNYVYVLKIDDGKFYVGQTQDLLLRYQEHRLGKQTQTSGKNPKLVYFEVFQGDREEVNRREDELTKWNTTNAGQRHLLRLIEEFRAPMRLVDWEA